MLQVIRKFKVTKKECVTDDLCRIWLVPDDGEAMFEFEAGQFVMIHELDEEGKSIYVRSYSLASAPYESGEGIELGVKSQGKMSGMLFDANEGDVFGVQGPFGQFKVPEDEGVVFFAGGVGITPFRSMIREALKNNIGKALTLFYSGRTQKELLYHDELLSLANENDDFIYVPILTREKIEGWLGENNRLDTEMMKKYVKDFGAGYLMCGPNAMMDHVKEILENKGVDTKTKLRSERY
jgi:ferredoxin-NADP reductase